MTDDEKLALVDMLEKRNWSTVKDPSQVLEDPKRTARYMTTSHHRAVQMESLEVIERCQRIRAHIESYHDVKINPLAGCALCSKPLDMAADNIQWDMPNERFQLFCGIECLQAWSNARRAGVPA